LGEQIFVQAVKADKNKAQCAGKKDKLVSVRVHVHGLLRRSKEVLQTNC
jgi:UTP:GlnB (protein PII) uridylyltransferase